MQLTIYDIIKGPVVTDKAYKMNRLLNQLVIKVHVQANKPMICEAIEKLFNVKIEKVRVIIRKPKKRSINRYPIKVKTTKKAIITLKEGYSIEVFGQAGGATVNLDKTYRQE